ncbi:tail protein [uncultured phage cr54_1]|uniref:Tail protein Pb4 n=1 Tax=uncultured phage cr54_1 TaxID=2986398 RepID=A0AAE7RWG5_9CAUD|nr:tail protein [uncultured phage cr54_1]QWM89955.1 tail protein Pb4 [uncultured phage cr54_1]
MNAITVGQLINNNATDKDFKPFPNLDFKYGPYSSIAEALSNIPAELRAVGLTVGIRVNNTIQEFWFNGGVRDADLVVKNNGSGGGSGEAGKTPEFDKAIALALPADAAPTAEVVYKGEDESGTPLYDLEFGIPAGEAGTVPNWKTFVFKQSATQPDPPTGEDIIPAGWSNVPTVVGIWWMSVGEVRGATGKVTSWSTPIKCTGEDGVAGKYYNFKYAVNTSPSDAPAINRNADDPGSEWSDIVPAMDKGQYLWMTIGMFNGGKLEGQWSAPIRINAEDGQSGVGVRMMYQKTIDYVNAPPFDEDNINPGSAWSTTIPSGSGAVWGIFAQINIDGTLASNWAGPVLMSGKPGADGTDGTDGTVPNWKTYIYAKSTTIPTKPTSQELIPAGWKDSPDSNDGQWWQCIGTVDGSSNKVVSWSDVIPVNGRDGDAQDGKHTEFRFASSPSATEHPSITRSDRNPGAAWTVEFPTLTTSSPYMWMTKATILPSNAIEGYWEDPVCITGEAGKKGDTGPAGKDGVNGSNGIDGVPGISIEARYSLGSDTAPSAAFDSTIAKQRNPDGWSLTVPVPTQEKLYIWCIQTRISYNSNSDKLGHLELDWSTPFKLTGTNGLPGSDGHNQIIYPQGIYDSTKSYVSDEYKAPYVYDPADGNFYVLNYEGPWKGTDQVYSTPSASVANNQRFWIKFEGYEAIYTKIGIIANGLIGSAVFNGNYMFSQQGVNANGIATTSYEDFNPNDPYAESNTFKPNICIDFANGNVWFGGSKHHLNKDGSGYLSGKNIILQANGDVLSNQFDKAYLTTNTDIYLPKVPYGYTKTILIPYFTTRSSPVLKLHVNGDRDRILFKDPSDSNKLKITSLGATLSYTIIGLGHGCVKLVGYDNGIDISSCVWQLTNDFYGEPATYNG